MLIYRHKLGASISVFRMTTQATGVTLRIRRLADGFWFNRITERFVATIPILDEAQYNYEFSPTPDGAVSRVFIIELPGNAERYIFSYSDGVREIHDVGEVNVTANNPMCLIFGTVITASGAPVADAKVEVLLNRTGFFTNVNGFLGRGSTVITDEAGYFEVPVVQGLNVTISIPAIGFSTRGIVPPIASLELGRVALIGGRCSGS